MISSREKERKALLYLNEISSIGSRTLQKIKSKYGSYAHILEIEETRLGSEKILNKKQIEELVIARKRGGKEGYLSEKKYPCNVCTILDESYPSKLTVLYDYPHVLYYKGILPKKDRLTIGIVGSRCPSNYGIAIAKRFAKELSSEGIQIVSGLASGIDAVAHKGTIDAKGVTFGVLGCGINICYPTENYNLYKQVLVNGGIITEFPLDMKPYAPNFPRRNRIISGLCDGLIVVEAKEKSGTSITVEHALDIGKDIFAIPGRIGDRLSEGCNRLIQQGANLTQNPEEILGFYNIKSKKIVENTQNLENTLANNEKMLYSCLDLYPKHIDEISNICGLSMAELINCLLRMEMMGIVVQKYPNYYEKGSGVNDYGN